MGRSCNYIYGGEVFISQKKQINPNKWKGRLEFNWYILHLLRKNVNYFKIWGNLVGKSFSLITKITKDNLDNEVKSRICSEKDDHIEESNGRVYFWSNVNFNKKFWGTKGRGHGKQQGIFKGNTFCIKDLGREYLGE